MRILQHAIEPLAPLMRPAMRNRLHRALSVVYGIESYVIAFGSVFLLLSLVVLIVYTLRIAFQAGGSSPAVASMVIPSDPVATTHRVEAKLDQ